MKSEHQQRVIEFMNLAGQDTPQKAIMPSEEVRMLRAKLILEECLETIRALGMDIKCNSCEKTDDVRLVYSREPNLEEILDGCADISVVTIGTLCACGIDDTELLKAVDQNNLDKFGPGHQIREDGKLVKPPGHKPPNIKSIMEQNGWQDE
jgi:predicted HAD superfamily Cof-like phosphohydrolase